MFALCCLYLCLLFGCFMACGLTKEKEEFNIMKLLDTQTVWSMLFYLSTTSQYFLLKLTTILHSKFIIIITYNKKIPLNLNKIIIIFNFFYVFVLCCSVLKVHAVLFDASLKRKIPVHNYVSIVFIYIVKYVKIMQVN